MSSALQTAGAMLPTDWQDYLPPVVRTADEWFERTMLEIRFASYVKVEGECSVWTGAKAGKGYGVFYIAKRDGRSLQPYAHRVAWVLAHGPIPPGLVICHRCDNPACVRLDHLFLGTQADNMRDCSQKGRTKNGSTRFDSATAREIRARHAGGGITQTTLAAEYDMSFQHVSQIVNNLRWKETV